MRLRSIILAVAVAAPLVSGRAAPDARAAASPTPRVVGQTEALLRDSIASDSRPCRSGVTQCFSESVWRSADPAVDWFCQVGPGTAAAVLWRATGRRDRHLWRLAVGTFDAAIAGHRNPNGSFGSPSESPAIASMFFGDELGTTYLELEPWLRPTTRARWLHALTGAANFLIVSGELTWYSNGNINLGNAELFYLAWRASHDFLYWLAYNQAWSFALHPPQGRWPGSGLHPRVLAVANTLIGALLPRVTTANWALNTSGGTRHPQPGRLVPFTTPGLAVLGWLGGRRGLATMFPSQLRAIDHYYRGALTYSNPGMYRGLGTQVAVILQAALAYDLRGRTDRLGGHEDLGAATAAAPPL